jgi:hypothetical protein
MILSTPLGDFGLVVTGTDREAGTVTLRAGRPDALDSLRAAALPELSDARPSRAASPGWEARAPQSALTRALAVLAAEPAQEVDAPAPWIARADLYGAVLVLPGPVFLLLRPGAAARGSHFPIARSDEDETPDATAHRALREQTSLRARVLGALPGRFSGPGGLSAFFAMEPMDGAAALHAAGAALQGCTFQEAQAMIGQVSEPRIRQRDTAVLMAAAAWLASR